MLVKKYQEKEKSTIESLPKELQDRIVNVGTGIPLSGNTSHTSVNSTTNLLVNGVNAFPNPSTIITQASEPKEEKTVKKDIAISINYGTSGGSIKRQLKAQGFKFDKDLIKGCEVVRLDLLALLDIDILTVKQGQKAFKKLNTIISNNVIETTFGDVKSKLKKTFINNKEVK